MPQTKENPGCLPTSTGALQMGDERNPIASKYSGQSDSGQRHIGHRGHDFADPTHPDAKAIWPILLPIVGALLNASFDLEAYYPRLSRLLHRMADVIQSLMKDAELGLLHAHPEKRVKARSRRGR